MKLISGHTGFVGQHLIDKLEGEKRGFTRSVAEDMNRKEDVERAVSGASFVYHLAANTDPGESKRFPRDYFMENVDGTINFLEACRKFDVPLLYTSSCEVYGDGEFLTEESEFKPTNPYAASKAACDRLCHAYRECYGMDIRIVRLFNPYGPAQQENKIIPIFYNKIINKEPVPIYGDGSDTRDFVYIDDVVSAMIAVGEKKKKGGTFNIATGKTTSVKEVADLVAGVVGVSVNYKFMPYPKYGHGGFFKQSCKPNKIFQYWEPQTDIREGIRRTIEWLKTT